jgi:hypothetical protein
MAPIPTAARSTGEPVGERSVGPPPGKGRRNPRPPTGAPGEGAGEGIYERSTGTRVGDYFTTDRTPEELPASTVLALAEYLPKIVDKSAVVAKHTITDVWMSPFPSYEDIEIRQ